MATAVRKRLSGGLLSLGSLVVIASGMAVIDETFRRTLAEMVRGQYQLSMTMPDLRLQHLVRVVSETAGFSSASQGPMMLFVGFGLVLFVLMFKT